MTNPVTVERLSSVLGQPAYRSIYTFCPGCHMAHPFRIELFPGCPLRQDGSIEPIWTWDGNLETPTFSPSMLSYGSCHLCPTDYVHHVVCLNSNTCGNVGHLILSKEPRILAHNLPHIVDPAWGNCHSFLHNGQWQFLTDSAHSLAGQTVDMIPLPDWLM